MKILYVYLVLINLAALVLMAEDKRRAKRRLWRIRERTLFALALLGGQCGSPFGHVSVPSQDPALVLRGGYAADFGRPAGGRVVAVGGRI